MPDRLWICDKHEMIGNQQEGHGHRMAHGCEVTELDQETSDAVREQWAQDHIEMVAALAVFGPGIAAASREDQANG